jgi:hypothetical protein
MRSALWITSIATLGAVLAGGQSKSVQMSATAQRALLDRYCVSCHNQKAKIGGLALDTVDLSRAGDHAETLE